MLACSAPLQAQEADGPEPAPEETISAGDTAWMLTSSALVLMMTGPGLALFYGGLVRKKNILGVMMQCFFLMALMSVVWALYGYSLSFAAGNQLIGGLGHVFLKGVAPYYDGTQAVVPVHPDYAIPHEVFMVFQGMFFIITPALICGAFAERMKFSAMVVFMVLWGTLVYCPLAHWVWGGGWLGADGRFPGLDFAGGTVVHISSGVSGLVCALVLGKRLHYGEEPMLPHNLTYTCLGACLLWVGWFGFNAGSAGAANGVAANAFVVTHLASAAACLAWAGCEWVQQGKPSLLGACSGAVAGLVCITPASGYVTPMASLVFGLAGGIVCYCAVAKAKGKLGYDDSLDAFGIHGVGGTLGALLTGVFASRAVSTNTGLLEGNAGQFVNNLVGAVAAWVLAAVVTLVILKVVEATVGLRVTSADEMVGLDLSQHDEEGYIMQ
jgi:Amt family ammonium transporter